MEGDGEGSVGNTEEAEGEDEVEVGFARRRSVQCEIRSSNVPIDVFSFAVTVAV